MVELFAKRVRRADHIALGACVRQVDRSRLRARRGSRGRAAREGHKVARVLRSDIGRVHDDPGLWATAAGGGHTRGPGSYFALVGEGVPRLPASEYAFTHAAALVAVARRLILVHQSRGRRCRTRPRTRRGWAPSFRRAQRTGRRRQR